MKSTNYLAQMNQLGFRRRLVNMLIVPAVPRLPLAVDDEGEDADRSRRYQDRPML